MLRRFARWFKFYGLLSLSMWILIWFSGGPSQLDSQSLLYVIIFRGIQVLILATMLYGIHKALLWVYRWVRGVFRHAGL